ncbi:zinc-ribbon domain-containing protein [Microbacterium sp. SS28]|uniref:zinc-ribbon domain-containing protein n=1 Tax=Microbacterium sp. SS28 TaxID=2919948 RepID=UPI001FA9AA5B|nr:zinc-ribbon domain-containing protein [Microbacterium sp. SS28]
MAERVEAWWARRQFSRGADVPYPIGTYREAWAPYPALIRQYHPDLNAGITLTQIPPAADVLLLWQCEAGHTFAATPTEQRARPGRERRRSAWCPDCTSLAKPARTPWPGEAPRARVPASARAKRPKTAKPLCAKTPAVPVGEPFASVCAPAPASAVEGQLRADVFGRLAVTTGLNAVRVSRPFFDHVEVWPDILLPELRIAIEYDTPGRFGLEHVGGREDADRRKDRALRAAHWEVVRIRTGRLEKLGPHDLQVAKMGRKGLAQLIDVFRDIRGPLLVDAYLT